METEVAGVQDSSLACVDDVRRGAGQAVIHLIGHYLQGAYVEGFPILKDGYRPGRLRFLSLYPGVSISSLLRADGEGLLVVKDLCEGSRPGLLHRLEDCVGFGAHVEGYVFS
ncbi:hypothetical protein ES703_49638 [subsurface metagenome]